MNSALLYRRVLVNVWRTKTNILAPKNEGPGRGNVPGKFWNSALL